MGHVLHALLRLTAKGELGASLPPAPHAPAVPPKPSSGMRRKQSPAPFSKHPPQRLISSTQAAKPHDCMGAAHKTRNPPHALKARGGFIDVYCNLTGRRAHTKSLVGSKPTTIQTGLAQSERTQSRLQAANPQQPTPIALSSGERTQSRLQAVSPQQHPSPFHLASAHKRACRQQARSNTHRPCTERAHTKPLAGSRPAVIPIGLSSSERTQSRLQAANPQQHQSAFHLASAHKRACRQ
jgi:hypothetical protein